MLRTGVLKISGAFLAGLVVALGSALLYVRTQDRDTTAVARVEQAIPPAPAANPETPPASEPAPAAVPAAAVSRPASTHPVAVSKVSPPKHFKRTPALRPRIVAAPDPPPPVQVVENTPANSVPVYPPIAQPEPVAEQPVANPAAVAPEPQPQPQPHQVTLGAGTAVSIRLGETLSTEHNYAGDTFRGTLAQPIVRDGFIIADKGSKVLGRIVDATPAGRVRGVSNLSLTLTEINTTDGQRVRVNTNAVEKRGTATTGSDAAKIAGGAAIGAIIGALGGGGKGAAIGAGAGGAAGTGIVLATRGKPAVLPSESLLNFQLSDPVTITERLNH
ncbi:MAG TPA: hypothetical protein VKX25_11300 [Bryobacteraceae bacterium]|nr:hypothetical protein [Bryobacteraceae bacterium]